MVDLNRQVPRVRTFVLAFAFALSATCLGLSAKRVSRPWSLATWSILGLVSSILTIIAVQVLFLSAHYKKGLRLGTELVILFNLSFLWLPIGIIIADTRPEINKCLWGPCLEARAIGALAFANFALLFLYTFALSILAVSAYANGAKDVWRVPVIDFEWNQNVADVEGAGEIHI